MEEGEQSTGAGGMDQVVVLTTAVDDASGEGMGWLTERLLAAGALDAYWTPVYMKKGRPAAELTVLSRISDEAALVEIVFGEAGTFGIRRCVVQRHVLDRELVHVEVGGGEEVAVKVGRRAGRVVVLSPEYEDCRRVARDREIPVRDVMDRARHAARGVVRPEDSMP